MCSTYLEKSLRGQKLGYLLEQIKKSLLFAKHLKRKQLRTNK